LSGGLSLVEDDLDGVARLRVARPPFKHLPLLRFLWFRLGMTEKTINLRINVFRLITIFQKLFDQRDAAADGGQADGVHISPPSGAQKDAHGASSAQLQLLDVSVLAGSRRSRRG
jgi:hypothetical protein